MVSWTYSATGPATYEDFKIHGVHWGQNFWVKHKNMSCLYWSITEVTNTYDAGLNITDIMHANRRIYLPVSSLVCSAMWAMILSNAWDATGPHLSLHTSSSRNCWMICLLSRDSVFWKTVLHSRYSIYTSY